MGFHRLTSGYLPGACAHRRQPSVASEMNIAKTKVTSSGLCYQVAACQKKKKMLQVKNEKQKSIFSKSIINTHNQSRM